MTEPERASRPSPEPPDSGLEALWARALAEWESDAPHAALLQYALHGGKLPDLAGRYRALSEDAEKGARAKKQLDAIVVAATQMMMSMKTPRVDKAPPGMVASVAVLCLLALGFLAYAMWHMSARP